MKAIVYWMPIIASVALSGCAPDKPKRHPMVQREVDQCIAGMGGLVPDNAKRKIVCECVADASAELKHQFDTDALAVAINQCNVKAGLDPKNPFNMDLSKNSSLMPDNASSEGETFAEDGGDSEEGTAMEALREE